MIFPRGIVFTDTRNVSPNLESPLLSKMLQPLYPPTIVQFYTTKRVNFLTSTVISTTKKNSLNVPNNYNNLHVMPLPHILSYQAVQVIDFSKSMMIDNFACSVDGYDKNDIKHLRPNLGVWDCAMCLHYDRNVDVASHVLSVIKLNAEFDNKNKIIDSYIMTIDLEDPDTVYPFMTTSIKSIIKSTHLKTRKKTNFVDSIKKNRITVRINFTEGIVPLSKLQSVVFGASPSSLINKKYDKKSSLSGKENHYGRIMIRLILLVIIPPEKKTDTYKKVQTQRFLLYHVKLYAAILNCTLCFLKTGNDTNDNNIITTNINNGLCCDRFLKLDPKSIDKYSLAVIGRISIEKLASLVRNLLLCSFEKLKNTYHFGKTEQNCYKHNNCIQVSTPSFCKIHSENIFEYVEEKHRSLYFSGDHDIGIIQTTLLRSASFPKFWDAEKDSLWEVLTFSVVKIANKSLNTSLAGLTSKDEKWLTILLESLSSLTGNTRIANTGVVSVTNNDSSFATCECSSKSCFHTTSSTVTKYKKDELASSSNDNKDVVDFFKKLLKK